LSAGISISEGGVNEALAAAGAATSEISDGGKGTSKEDIEENGKIAENANTTEEEGAKNTEDGVQTTGASDALNGLVSY